MGLFVLAECTLEGRDIWLAAKAPILLLVGERRLLPGFEFGPVAAGVVMHLTVSGIWGWIFGEIAAHTPPWAELLAGVLWGPVVFLVMRALLRQVGAAVAVHQLIGVDVLLMAHVVFGIVLALAFLRVRELSVV
jgi:hypothetical protein